VFVPNNTTVLPLVVSGLIVSAAGNIKITDQHDVESIMVAVPVGILPVLRRSFTPTARQPQSRQPWGIKLVGRAQEDAPDRPNSRVESAVDRLLDATLESMAKALKRIQQSEGRMVTYQRRL